MFTSPEMAGVYLSFSPSSLLHIPLPRQNLHRKKKSTGRRWFQAKQIMFSASLDYLLPCSMGDIPERAYQTQGASINQ